VDEVKGHVDRASTRVGAALDSVLAALKKDPGSVVKQAAQAGGSAVTHAAGALFVELGKQLQQLGAKLRP
jgi:hypothetical protein